VINAGVPGYCPLLSYLQFKHSLASLQPDLLVLNLDMSDVSDDHRYRRHTRLGTTGTPLLCAHPSLQPASKGSAGSTGQGMLLFQSLKQQLGLLPADETRASDQAEIESTLGQYAWTRENRPDWQVYIAQALAPISDLRNLSNQLSCPLIVTLSPAPWQVSERAMPDPTARRHWGIAPGKVFDPSLATGQVIQFLDANSIPYCDATGPFREAERPEALFHETVPRFSRRGHALFARLVANYLKTSSLLPSSSPAFSPIPTASY
jgi:hypothetical protein